MFERASRGDRAVLLSMTWGKAPAQPEDLAEFRVLVAAAGAEVVATLTGARVDPEPKFSIGFGKLCELKQLVLGADATMVIFDHELSPAQERNLERELQCRVIDRTGLILDIFAQRARSFEGKLQVELAQLRHLSTRLVRGWSHLERQKGGIGLRGPGETQLETDRRLISKRIATLKGRLDRILTRRAQNRRARERADLPTVALVGYTNAGKSTLFNRLTNASVYQADQLFATLDPTLRRLSLKSGLIVVLADTVGFVSRLPHELIAAFRATLEEAMSADLLLHVVDSADPRHVECMADVDRVLDEIGAVSIPTIQVFNKIDAIEGLQPRVDRDSTGQARRVWLSAKSGEGTDLLREAIVERFMADKMYCHIRLVPAEGSVRAWLFTNAKVLSEQINEAGNSDIEVLVSRPDLNRLLSRAPSLADRVYDAEGRSVCACG